MKENGLLGLLVWAFNVLFFMLKKLSCKSKLMLHLIVLAAGILLYVWEQTVCPMSMQHREGAYTWQCCLPSTGH